MCKIIFLFCGLFICFNQLYANKSVDTMSICFTEQSLDSALLQLEKQSGYKFLYQDTIVGEMAKMNLRFEDKTVSEILDVLLAETGYSYVVIGNTAIFYKNKYLSETGAEQEFVPFSITGTVVDENGEKVRGASVYLKDGVSTGAVTNKDGSFTISATSPNTYLVVAYLGYLPRVVDVSDAELIKIEPNMELLNKIFKCDCLQPLSLSGK
jgi:hypothetical protein